MYNIGWVQDIDPLIDLGGAQKNDLGMIRFIMKNTGAEIDIIIPQNIGSKLLKKYDLLIFSNCVKFPKEHIEAIIKKNPYVIFHHDYLFCRFRLYYPGDKTCVGCPGFEWWHKFIAGAKKNIFLSPMHREMHEIIFTKKELGPSITIPSCIDTEFWHPTEGDIRMPKTVISVNGLEVFKGRYNHNEYIEKHPELQFTFVGGGIEINKPNVKYLPVVGQEELRKLYSQHEYFMSLPPTAMPFDRVIPEAYLCGCKLIVNENLGALSYKWDWANKEQILFYLKQAAVGFKDEIFQLLEKGK